MSANEIAHVSAQLITKDFGLDNAELENTPSMDILESRLVKIVQYLLDQDFQRLINSMYRIDLPESTFKEILANEKPDQIASSLASAILGRELQKAELRQKYSGE
jgi:hypothetical protein